MKPLTFGSLFAGIGGLDLGLERAGMQCRWQVEIDPYAQKVLKKHWPNTYRFGDVRQFPPNPYTLTQEEFECVGDFSVDLIGLGFPCQDISQAGHGAGLEGERSGLFYEGMRVIRLLRPRFVLVENVAALLRRGLDAVLGEFSKSGYDAEWQSIPAAAVGAPHIRDRVWILAYTRQEFQRFAGLLKSRRRRDSVFPEGTDGGAQVGRADRELVTLVPGIHPRVPADWWRSQSRMDRTVNGVPNWMERNCGLGNAMCPQVAEWIGRRIVEIAK